MLSPLSLNTPQIQFNKNITFKALPVEKLASAKSVVTKTNYSWFDKACRWLSRIINPREFQELETQIKQQKSLIARLEVLVKLAKIERQSGLLTDAEIAARQKNVLQAASGNLSPEHLGSVSSVLESLDPHIVN